MQVRSEPKPAAARQLQGRQHMKTEKIREILLGKPLDPLKTETRHSLALVAFIAWVGLGADGLSSSAYGPEEAFKALGGHGHFGLYLAIATAVTVFIISIAYNQVIELFPTGGGGYRIASTLIGPYAGLVSGAALIVDYVLTIAISIASGVDQVFSLLPLGAQAWKLGVEIALVGFLLFINLRGARNRSRCCCRSSSWSQPSYSSMSGCRCCSGSSASVATGRASNCTNSVP